MRHAPGKDARCGVSLPELVGVQVATVMFEWPTKVSVIEPGSVDILMCGTSRQHPVVIRQEEDRVSDGCPMTCHLPRHSSQSRVPENTEKVEVNPEGI
jgi:hypothetical protein